MSSVTLTTIGPSRFFAVCGRPKIRAVGPVTRYVPFAGPVSVSSFSCVVPFCRADNPQGRRVLVLTASTTVSKATKRLDARQTSLLVRKDAGWTAHLSSTAHLSQRLPVNEQLASVPPLLFTAICLLRLHVPACDPAPTLDNATSNDREPIVPETTLSAYLQRLRRRAWRALPSRSFSSIPLLSIESRIRWNRTLHCRGESCSPFRVKTGHFSMYGICYTLSNNSTQTTRV